MLLAMRQLAVSPVRPTLSQPWRYIGKCEATQFGWRKFAEIGSQPRAAAEMTPFENGAVTVTTIGGCGLLEGVNMTPPPRARVGVRAGARGPDFSRRLFGGSSVHHAKMWSILSTHTA